VGKKHQTRDATVSTPELTLPAEVSVALADIAHSAKEGLLALAVGAMTGPRLVVPRDVVPSD
jgi:hypothetical protein